MKFYILVLLFALAAIAAAQDDDESARSEFQSFRVRFGKRYRSKALEEASFARFKLRRAEVNQHNEEFKQGLQTFSVKLNEMSDMSDEDRKNLLGAFVPSNVQSEMVETREKRQNIVTAPPTKPTTKSSVTTKSTSTNTVDWRSLVPTVKNQRSCGSCWSFSVVGPLEAAIKRSCGKTVDIAEQYLVDCSSSQYSTYGCSGGWPIGAIQFMAATDVPLEQNYPYTSTNGSCKNNGNKIGVKLQPLTFGPSSASYAVNDATLKKAVADNGPLSVCIEVDNAFYNYANGVYVPASTVTGKCQHAVILVGYGSDSVKGEYWLVKNSWGETWGDAGYIKMKMGTPTGILNYPFGIKVTQCPK